MDGKIILASGSPRRKEILQQVGIAFEVLTSDIEEKTEEVLPGEVVKDLSRQKAEEVKRLYAKRNGADEKSIYKKEGKQENIVFLAADTVVACDGDILGKPSDEADAFAMIDRLQGNTHEVYTGVTLLAWDTYTDKEEYVVFAEATKVKVRPMTAEQIQAYIKTKEPMDKAGAYGIQGAFAAYITGIEGDYYNVVGLPAARVCEELERLRERSCL